MVRTSPLEHLLRSAETCGIRDPAGALVTALMIALVSMGLLTPGAALRADSGDAVERELSDLLTLLPGQYAGPLATQQTPDREGQLFHTIQRIDLPAYGEEVVLHVLSLQGFDDPEPFQQKFYRFDLSPDRDRNSMRSVVMMRAARWQPGDTLEDERLIRFPPECAIQWRRDDDSFIARVKRGDCVYRSEALGGDILPDMTYVVDSDSFAISDVLYRADGTAIVPDTGLSVAGRRK